MNGQIFHDKSIRSLLQVDFSLDVFAQQVMDFFVVDFDKCALNEVVFAGLTVGNCHDLVEGAGNNTHGWLLKFETGDCYGQVLFVVVIADHLSLFCRQRGCHTKHRVSFSTTCLAIGEYGTIVAIDNILYKRKRRLFVDLLLGGVLAEDIVICKVFNGGIDGGDFFESDLMCGFIDDDNVFTVCFKIEKDLVRFIFDSWVDNAPWPWQIQSLQILSLALLLYCW